MTRKSEYSRARHLKRAYGIDEFFFDSLLKKQSRRCAICSDRTKLVVDHCHKTKIIRGLLCCRCNSMIGMAKESKRILREAIAYLVAWKKN